MHALLCHPSSEALDSLLDQLTQAGFKVSVSENEDLKLSAEEIGPIQFLFLHRGKEAGWKPPAHHLTSLLQQPHAIVALVDDVDSHHFLLLLEAGFDEVLRIASEGTAIHERLNVLATRLKPSPDTQDTTIALQESLAKASAVLETTVDGIITIDERGKIESYNASAALIFGYSFDEVEGRNVSMLMPAPYKQDHDDYLRSYQDTHQRKIIGIGREVIGQRKDGSTFPMELAVSEVLLTDRIIYTGIVRDISKRRGLENELLRMSEQERARIGRDLHDGLGQTLTGIGLISQNIAQQLEKAGSPSAKQVAEISTLIKEADQEAH